MTPAERNELKRLASEATPGPWSIPFPEKYGAPNYSYIESPSGHIAITHVNGIYRSKCAADAAYIAAAHPQAILSLITELESRPRREDVLEEAAQICDEKRDNGLNADLLSEPLLWVDGYEHASLDCAKAIRALAERQP